MVLEEDTIDVEGSAQSREAGQVGNVEKVPKGDEVGNEVHNEAAVELAACSDGEVARGVSNT